MTQPDPSITPAPEGAVAIGGSSASPRRYWRLPSGLVQCDGTNAAENRAFLHWTRRFTEAGLPVPRVHGVSPDGLSYTLDDLGDTSLLDLRGTPAFHPAMCAALTMLPRFQAVPRADGDDRASFPVAEIDKTAAMWDLNYFKYCFLLPSGVTLDEPGLDDDFKALARVVETSPRRGLLMRDFQSRNIMVRPDGSTWLIDYQGARRGPVLYDVASMLWQARLGLTPDERQAYAEVYRRAAGWKALPWRELEQMALLRLLQVLGAYGFRGLVQRKPAFMRPIRAAVAELGLLTGALASYPAIAHALEAVAASLGADRVPQAPAGAEPLTVAVHSFGFRRSGPPADPSGNGGGFVFDCRALPNPHRVDALRPLTGLDAPVAGWLAAQPAVAEFVDHAAALVEASVERYVSRGFTSLQVAFGCTGGQHRSVYCAETLAARLAALPGVNVTIHHAELPRP